jgi:hypothetical protein
LTPGEYELSVSADGYAPATKLIEVTMNHDEHKLAPMLNFKLTKLTPEQLAERVVSAQNLDTTNGDILLDDGQLMDSFNGVEPDEDVMDSPSDWTSISEQYAPLQDTFDVENEEENGMDGMLGNRMPDYAYDYAEMPPNYATQDNLEDHYY